MRRFITAALLACVALAAACKPKAPPAPAAPVAATNIPPSSEQSVRLTPDQMALLESLGNNSHRLPLPPSNPTLVVHFAGTDALAKNPDTEKLSEILKLPASQELLKRTIEKLYVIATRNDPTNAPGLPPNFVPPLRAALGDIFSSETVLAVRENNGTVAGWALALRMPASRPDKTPELAQFQKGDWLVFGKNTGGSSIHENWILRIKSTGSPVAPLGTNWLQVSISPQFAKVIGWPASVEWPLTDFILNAHTNSIRTEAKFTFPDSLALNLAPWRVPTNSIQDPLVSFTAGRGTAAWLQRLPGFPQLQLPAPPNQFFVWSRSDIPYQTFLAAPLQNAAAQIPRITPGIETFARTNLGPRFFGEFLFVINRNELVWRGLPILVPFLRAAPEPGGDFALLGMMAGIVPRTPNTNPPPAEMLAQFTGRTNVVYYDWEITQTRLQQWWQITRLLAMLANDPARLGPSPGQDWLAAITPLLGNTVTEITAGGPRELHLTRKSHIGLTGIELVLLARWLDNPDFPAWNYPTPKPPAMPPPPPKK